MSDTQGTTVPSAPRIHRTPRNPQAAPPGFANHRSARGWAFSGRDVPSPRGSAIPGRDRTPRAWAGTRSGETAAGTASRASGVKVLQSRPYRVLRRTRGGFSSSLLIITHLPLIHRLPSAPMEKEEPSGAVNTTRLGGSSIWPTDPRAKQENSVRIKFAPGRADANTAVRTGRSGTAGSAACKSSVARNAATPSRTTGGSRR